MLDFTKQKNTNVHEPMSWFIYFVCKDVVVHFFLYFYNLIWENMYSKWFVYKGMSFNFDLAREYVEYVFITIMRENWMIYMAQNEKYVNYNFLSNRY